MDTKHHVKFQQLGLNIAHYRKLRGMNQLQLAEATGLSRTHISNIEAPNGTASVSLSRLFDIADALDIPVKLLFEFHELNEKKKLRIVLRNEKEFESGCIEPTASAFEGRCRELHRVD